MICVFLLYDGSTRRLTESDFMEKPGIEPATTGLQGIALIHYTTGKLIIICNDIIFIDFTIIIIPSHFKKCGVLCYTLHSKNCV